MNISIVVTCFNEEKNIGRCLDSLVAQNYNFGEYEIIISDGASKDNTQEIIKQFCEKYPLVKLVIEPKKGTAAGRNAGVAAARYDFIAFIDADCEASADWLGTLATYYESTAKRSGEIAAVGGRNIAPNEGSDFVHAIEIALDSYLGSFNSAQGRQFSKPTFVRSLATVNALYDRKKIADIGFFDETLGSEAEDADLNFRLYSSGYKFLFIPESSVWHWMRPTPLSWIKNMYRYGRGRARLLKRHPGMFSLSFALPIVFLCIMAVSPLGLVQPLLFAPLLYFPFIVVFSAFQCLRKKSFRLTFLVSYIYIVQHFAYSFGEIRGFLSRNVI